MEKLINLHSAEDSLLLRCINCRAIGEFTSLNSGLGERQNFFLPSGQQTLGQQSSSISQGCTFQNSSAKGTFGHFTGTPKIAAREKSSIFISIKSVDHSRKCFCSGTGFSTPFVQLLYTLFISQHLKFFPMDRVHCLCESQGSGNHWKGILSTFGHANPISKSFFWLILFEVGLVRGGFRVVVFLGAGVVVG